MGLSASQARLLTITGRKSDCEFESMRLSHQKISIARSLADLSNEYQNSLNQTKLIYDYYGTGDTTTPLSYSVLTYPSALNDYMPKPVTTANGRVVLDNKLAAAAKAAGIPMEGLGTLPSEIARNNFMLALSDSGVITSKLAETITSLPYNQEAGLGGGPVVITQTQDISISKLAEKLSEQGESIDWDSGSYNGVVDGGHLQGFRVKTGSPTNMNEDDETIWGYWWYDMGGSYHGDGEPYNTETNTKLTIGKILEDYLNNEKHYYLLAEADQGENNIAVQGGILDNLFNSGVWDQMFSEVENILDTGDPYAQKALTYAKNKISEKLVNKAAEKNDEVFYWGEDSEWISKNNSGQKNSDYRTKLLDNTCTFVDNSAFDNAWTASHEVAADLVSMGYIGACASIMFQGFKSNEDGSEACGVIDVSNMLVAYLTYFADFMNGVSKLDVDGTQKYEVSAFTGFSKLVNDATKFTVVTGKDVSSDDLGQATFYDAWFNQICLNGWTQNNNVNDNEYLKNMLQNGMLFISKKQDDGYYYQGDYSLDSYIKEIPDETKIAVAEAKYNTEKAKLNAKEETLDLKMKNLDTEISALTTEYETVKSVITKNIEKGFKRYSA